MKQNFDERLARLHYRYLNHSGATEIRILTPDRRKPQVIARCKQEGFNDQRSIAARLKRIGWVDNEDDFINFIRPYTLPDDGFPDPIGSTPWQCYVVVRDEDPSRRWRDRQGLLYGKSTTDFLISGIQTLMLDIEPSKAVRPDGQDSTDEQLAACRELVEMIADWCEAQGWARPVLVMSGNGYHVYFAIEKITVTDENRAEMSLRLKAFERMIRAKFEAEADRRSLDIDSVSDLPRIMKIWGTPSVKGLDPSRHRLAVPMDDLPVRREDPILRRFLLDLDPAPTPTDEPQARKGTRRRRSEAAEKWPTDAIKAILPEALDDDEVPPIETAFKPAIDFLSDLIGEFERVHFDRSKFLWRVLAVQVFLYHQATGVPMADAAVRLRDDNEALCRVFKQWAKINVDLCTGTEKDAGEYKGYGRIHRYFLDDTLRQMAERPEMVERFLRGRGFFGKVQGGQPKRIDRPFEPQVVEWTARQQAQADWMTQIFQRQLAGLYINNAEPSVSKTTAALRLMRDHPDTRFLYFAPSHRLINDIVARALAMGIPEGDIVIAKGLDQLCDFKHRDRVKADAERGRSIRKKYCDPKKGLCGQADTCPWHLQRAEAKSARILFAPSAFLSQVNQFTFLVAQAWGNDTRDVWFIDEDATSYLGIRKSFSLGALRAYAAALDAHVDDGDQNAYLQELRPLVDFLLAFLETPAKAARQRTFTPPTATLDHWAWHRDRQRVRGAVRGLVLRGEGVEDPVLAPDAEGYTASLDLLLAQMYRRRFVWDDHSGAFDIEIAPEDEATDDTNGGQREAFGSLTFYKDREGNAYTFLPTPLLPWKQIFILDGTANHAFYEMAFRNYPLVDFFLAEATLEARSYVRPAGRVVQIVDSTNSRKKLADKDAMETVIASVIAFVQRRRAARPERRFLLVTYMDKRDGSTRFESHFREALEPYGVRVAHFGDIRGLDEFRGADTIVVGTFNLDPSAYADESRAVLGHNPSDHSAVMTPYQIPTLEAKSFEVKTPTYIDAGMRAAFEQKTLGELVQAIARSRVLVPDNDDTMVVVYSNYPLPGLLVEPMTLLAFNDENEIDRPSRYARGASHPQANVALRDAVARIFAEHPFHPEYPVKTWTREEVAAEVERRTGQRVTSGRIAQIWGEEGFDELTNSLQVARAMEQIPGELRRQGVAVEDITEPMLRAMAETAAASAIDFWIPYHGRLVFIQATGLPRGELREHKASRRAVARKRQQR